jgi:hypothetical protein
LFAAGDADFLTEHAQVVVITGRSHPTHLARVKIDSLRADKLTENLVAIEGADR